MASSVFLALIVSLDTYLAAAVYSNSSIKIPAASAFVISSISAAVLGISLGFSEILADLIPSGIFEFISLFILIGIGVLTIFKSIMRSFVRYLSDCTTISLKIKKLGIGINLYLDDTAADFDCSKVLSVKEAAALAIASSADSAATGLNCGFSSLNPIYTSLFTFIAGVIAISAGTITGKKVSSLKHDFSWVGGIMLIIFALLL